MMKRAIIPALAIIVFGFVTASATIIHVPDDYLTIQEGIDACAPGDTVMVENDVYFENVTINTPISLIGEDRDNTIIDGSGAGDVILIQIDGVFISSFTIRNGGSGMDDAGIEIPYTDNCTIELCKFLDNNAGLYLYGSSYNSIKRSLFDSNTYGIYFYEWPEGPYVDNMENLIHNNIIETNTNQGIFFEHMMAYHNSNQVYGNRISDNSTGIYMIMSQENEISYNDILNNTGYGTIHEVCIGGGDLNQFHHNNFISNNGGDVQGANHGLGTDYWYSQADQEGNYWSDYSGPDNNGDGIGDIPYDVDGDECEDLYPLMEPLQAIIDGVVINGASEPVEGVHATAVGTSVDDFTNLDGEYTLDGLGAGNYDISFSHPEYTDMVEPGVPATPGHTTTLDVVMHQPSEIPTLTEWGLIITALSLLAAGTIAVVKDSKAALSKAG
jgi:nitrous oxidase accessory protein